ncbi:MAG TPA: fatty acid cis/trans isomerase, partial [Burkholderiales bacterium]|nr:fatty acid cis/trans isomerase [Burkholderiales bacterium]
TLSLVTGFVGSYPNVFLEVDAKQLPEFVSAVRGLASEADFDGLFKRYGVSRTGAQFWAHSDEVHRAYRQWAPREAGVFDYNRLENR